MRLTNFFVGFKENWDIVEFFLFLEFLSKIHEIIFLALSIGVQGAKDIF